MDLKNAHKETAHDLVKGMAECKKEFRYAIAKDKIPRRTNEQEQIVKRKIAGRIIVGTTGCHTILVYRST